ncbi:guanylate kinase [bacterium]|nr:guanylate kinase [bacterium]
MGNRGICLVLSAPSGGGKTTLIQKMLQRFPGLRHSISYTTRNPRQDASDKHDYHFIDQSTFRKKIDNNEFLEWAEVHSKLYGTSERDLEKILSDGFDVVMDIDIQGTLQLMKQLNDAVYIFIMPPSMQILEERLVNRKSETRDSLDRRLENAKCEIMAFFKYDYIVINNDLELAVDQLRSILIAEHLNTSRKSVQEKVLQCLEGNE